MVLDLLMDLVRTRRTSLRMQDLMRRLLLLELRLHARCSILRSHVGLNRLNEVRLSVLIDDLPLLAWYLLLWLLLLLLYKDLLATLHLSKPRILQLVWVARRLSYGAEAWTERDGHPPWTH